MSGEPPLRFEPLRPASRPRLIVAFVFGPLLWLGALVIAAWVFRYTAAIAYGFAIVLASYVVALAVLAVTYKLRRRQERRYAERA
jgi:hypothetical protein